MVDISDPWEDDYPYLVGWCNEEDKNESCSDYETKWKFCPICGERLKEEFNMDILEEIEYFIRTEFSEDQIIEFINKCGKHASNWENLLEQTDFSKLNVYGKTFIALLSCHSRDIIKREAIR